jgi:hypothetical protein
MGGNLELHLRASSPPRLQARAILSLSFISFFVFCFVTPRHHFVFIYKKETWGLTGEVFSLGFIGTLFLLLHGLSETA